MIFRAISGKPIFLAIFVLALMVFFGLGTASADYDNPESSSEISLISSKTILDGGLAECPGNLIGVNNCQNEETKLIEKEIERIRAETERIRAEIERIKKMEQISEEIAQIAKETEQIKKELALLEKETHPEKITIPTKEEEKITPEVVEEPKVVEEKIEVKEGIVEEKPTSLLASSLTAVSTALGDLKRVLVSCLPWWLILIFAVLPLVKEVITLQRSKKETNLSLKTYFKKQGIIWLVSISVPIILAAWFFFSHYYCVAVWIFLILALATIFGYWLDKEITKRKVEATAGGLIPSSQKQLSSPTFFLLFGILITVCFGFIPRIYNPIIMKTLSAVSGDKTLQSSDYLSPGQNQNNIIKRVNLNIASILPAAMAYNDKFFNLKKTFGYQTEDYKEENRAVIVNSIIKATWFIFIFFFLFPIAVMLPLHWYERGKIRRAKRKIPGSPKVSLIFPAYNEEKFIHKTIEQGLKQDYKGELEIIIIDDGSTDKTFEIVNESTTRHPQLKVYKHDKNLGKPAALNTGFGKATGEISVFCDSDSYLDSDLVNKMIPHFDDPQVGMVSGMIVIDNEINLLTKLQQIEYLYNQEIIRFCQATHQKVLICPGAATAVRTEIAREIPSTERTITEDADFTFEVAKAGWKISQEPEAISRTDAPENWKELINQRKRWLYGVIQTIWAHKWALFYKDSKTPNLWVWWAWIGYVTCPITVFAVLLMPLFIKLIGTSYLIFLGFYSALAGAIFVFAHWYGIKQYTHAKKTELAILLPIYMVYQYILNLLLFYLVIAFILRKGITVRYGGRNIRAV